MKHFSRIDLLLFFSLCFILILLGHYSYTMLIRSSFELDHPRRQLNPQIRRGTIFDSQGKILALSVESSSVYAWKPHVESILETANTLGSLLEMDSQILFELINKEKGFFYIKRKIFQSQSQRIRQIQSEGRLKGIYLEEDSLRVYPQKELLGKALGFTGQDGIGLEGLEYSLNTVLVANAFEEALKEKKTHQRLIGNDVILTVDTQLQYKLEKILQETMQRENPQQITTLLLNAKTAEVLSYISLPSYNPNTYQDYPPIRWRNDPVLSIYEPGSVLKVFTLASILESGQLSGNEIFLDTGTYRKQLSNGQEIIINNLGFVPYGRINAEKILIHSSNVGMAYASERVSDEYFYQKLREFGFGQSTKVLFSQETPGILHSPQRWSARSKATISFGQEIGVSAMQIVQAATAFANEGRTLRPSIIKKIISPLGEILFEHQAQKMHQVLSPQTARQILDYMKTVSQQGARRSQVPGLSISVKTGTAQVIDEKSGTYSEDVFIASILALFPTEDPQYILYITVHGPEENIYGGQIAAPLARDLITYLKDHRYLKNFEKTEQLHAKNITIPPLEPLEMEKFFPQVLGKSKRELIPLLDELSQRNIRYTLKGEGYLVEQDPPAGTSWEDVQKVSLRFQANT